MANLVAERIESAREGRNRCVIGRMPSGWLVIGDVQPRPGYCLLLADPVVPSLNHLAEADRMVFLDDMARIGDALLQVTGAARINYEILGNAAPSLHAHLTPRYGNEPGFLRRLPPAVAYPRIFARRFDPGVDGAFIEAMRRALAFRPAVPR